MHIIDFIIFLIFTVGTVIFGCSFFKKDATEEDYTTAGRNLPSWLVGMSILATFVSSISYIGYPGKAFASDWNAFVFCLSIPIATVIASRWFVPFYRNSNSISAYAFLEERFGRWARLYASACYLLTQIARIGSILYLLAVPMYILMGWNIHLVILLTGIAIIIYSMMGGIKAVIWTDALQGFLLIGGALLCVFVILWKLPNGLSSVIDIAVNAPQGNKFSLGSFSGDITTSTFWVCLIYGIFINLQNYGIDQNYVQRYHTARTLHEAQRSVWVGGWLLIPVSALFFLIGTLLYAYYQTYPAQMSDVLLAKPDYVFPYFIVNQLPIGLRGLLISAIFAAGMSTVATSITSSATIFLTDWWTPYYNNARARKSPIRVLRTSSIIIGIIGVGVAIAMLSTKSIIDAWWQLSSVFSGGMLGLFLLAMLSRSTRSRHALIATLVGVIVIAWVTLAEPLNLPFVHPHPYLAIVLGTTAIFVVGFGLTILTSKKKKDKIGDDLEKKQ